MGQGLVVICDWANDVILRIQSALSQYMSSDLILENKDCKNNLIYSKR